MAGGWRWSSFRTWFMLHIYCFVNINGCIAIPVVKCAPVNLWDLGSSPSGILLALFHIFLPIFVWNRRLGLQTVGLYFFANFWLPAYVYTPGPTFIYFIIFIFLFYLHFIFSSLFLLLFLLLLLLLILLIKNPKIFCLLFLHLLSLFFLYKTKRQKVFS